MPIRRYDLDKISNIITDYIDLSKTLADIATKLAAIEQTEHMVIDPDEIDIDEIRKTVHVTWKQYWDDDDIVCFNFPLAWVTDPDKYLKIRAAEVEQKRIEAEKAKNDELLRAKADKEAKEYARYLKLKDKFEG